MTISIEYKFHRYTHLLTSTHLQTCQQTYALLHRQTSTSCASTIQSSTHAMCDVLLRLWLTLIFQIIFLDLILALQVPDCPLHMRMFYVFCLLFLCVLLLLSLLLFLCTWTCLLDFVCPLFCCSLLWVWQTQQNQCSQVWTLVQHFFSPPARLLASNWHTK